MTFIVLEGIDGCGKGTQVKLLGEYLKKKGKEVWLTAEPWESEYGKKIRELLRRRGTKISTEKWLELFTLDRKEHEREIREAMEEGKIVISDRYYYSTLAYQLPEEKWQEYTNQFLKPTITFILDLPVKTALKRLNFKYKNKSKKEYFEKKELLGKIRQKYLKMPNYLDDKIIIVNATKPIFEVFEIIKKELKTLLKI